MTYFNLISFDKTAVPNSYVLQSFFFKCWQLWKVNQTWSKIAIRLTKLEKKYAHKKNDGFQIVLVIFLFETFLLFLVTSKMLENLDRRFIKIVIENRNYLTKLRKKNVHTQEKWRSPVMFTGWKKLWLVIFHVNSSDI